MHCRRECWVNFTLLWGIRVLNDLGYFIIPLDPSMNKYLLKIYRLVLQNDLPCSIFFLISGIVFYLELSLQSSVSRLNQWMPLL